MIDLHLHLDGSLSLDDFRYLAKRNGVSLGEEFPKNVYVPEGCKSLEEYLTRFDLPCSLLQDQFSLAYVTKSLVNRLYEMGYIYAEIRFAPQLHTLKGMSQEEAVVGAITGLKEALKDKKNFDANLILCCMRQSSTEVNMPAIELADKYRHDKVVAVDLAGPEAFHTGDFYTPLFDEAKRRGLNIIIHAGEACGTDEVIRAVDLLHTQRIGHGVHLDINKDTVSKMIDKEVAFEFCPTSNLQTTSLPNYESVPLRAFDDSGILVTINSDNMTVSNTDVIQEFRHLYKTFNLTKGDVLHFLKNSITVSFASFDTKQMLLKELDKKIDKFYQQVSQ